VERQILVDSDQPEALTTRSLEVEVGVRNLELPGETGLENLSTRLLHVVGLELQPDRPEASQELTLIRDIPVEKSDEEVIAQPDEVSFGILFHDFAAQDVAIELANAVSITPRNQNR